MCALQERRGAGGDLGDWSGAFIGCRLVLPLGSLAPPWGDGGPFPAIEAAGARVPRRWGPRGRALGRRQRHCASRLIFARCPPSPSSVPPRTEEGRGRVGRPGLHRASTAVRCAAGEATAPAHVHADFRSHLHGPCRQGHAASSVLQRRPRSPERPRLLLRWHSLGVTC